MNSAALSRKGPQQRHTSFFDFAPQKHVHSASSFSFAPLLAARLRDEGPEEVPEERAAEVDDGGGGGGTLEAIGA